MSNSWALRGIKAILRDKRSNKPRLKDRSWKLKLRQKNRYITALENKNERLELEVKNLRAARAGLLAALDVYRFCHFQLKNTIEFADNGAAGYSADEELMSKFDSANDIALREIQEMQWYPPTGKPFNLDLTADAARTQLIKGPFFNQQESLFFNPIVGCVEHERDGQQEKNIWNGIRSTVTKALSRRYPITSDLVLTLKLDEEDKKRIQSIVDNDRDVAGGLYSREMLDLLTTGQIHHSTEGGKS